MAFYDLKSAQKKSRLAALIATTRAHTVRWRLDTECYDLCIKISCDAFYVGPLWKKEKRTENTDHLTNSTKAPM